ncbi:hypothetical protein LCGC14_0860830 [marine sediment metagenome]|uniref:Uncharacterized protein n=1 Tax=marine sediment metagenome TaxID=412755 RepID=A0A0F9P7I2_9ZZZZ
MGSKVMEKAIDRLADLFEYGNLMAATDPPAFMTLIADEIERLRKVNASLLEACEKMYGYFGPSSGYDGKAREALRKAEAAIAKARGKK